MTRKEDKSKKTEQPEVSSNYMKEENEIPPSPGEVDSRELDKISALLESQSKPSSVINSASGSSGTKPPRSSQRIELKGAERRKWLGSAIWPKILLLFGGVMIICLIFSGGYFLGTKKSPFFSLGNPGSKSSKSSTKKDEAKKKKESEAIEIDKAAVQIDVLNGNGIKGESGLIATHLRQSGWAILNSANADNHDYARTVLSYKDGFDDAAKLISKEISAFYPCITKKDLDADSKADIALILGKDRKVAKSSVKIRILNGNGKKGSAKEVTEILKNGGYEVKEITNADKFDYQESVISYKPGQEDTAKKIAKQIKTKYLLNLKEDSSLDVDIVILLGLK